MIAYSLVLIAAAAATGPKETLVTDVLRVSDAQAALIEETRVPAREAGVLVSLDVREGDRVKPGDVLGRVDAENAELEQEKARLDHDVAQLKSENDVDIRFQQVAEKVAARELERAVGSDKEYKASISETELDRKRLLVQQARLAGEQARRDKKLAEFAARVKKHVLHAAKKRVARCAITSPLEGEVVQVLKQRGEWMNPGDPLVRVLKLHPLRIEAFVDGSRFGNELKGKLVKFQTRLPGNQLGEFTGTVVFVSPELNPVNGQVRLYAEVQNPDFRLRPGTVGELTIQLRP